MRVLPDSAADLIARLLKQRGVKRVFALCGGHIMPIWMRLDAEGIRIIDVRDERAAVHMAQAHAELTGELGVALVTAGPGMTNAITGIANAHVSRAPVLVLSGGNPRPQENRGGLQDMDHVAPEPVELPHHHGVIGPELLHQSGKARAIIPRPRHGVRENLGHTDCLQSVVLLVEGLRHGAHARVAEPHARSRRTDVVSGLCHKARNARIETSISETNK